MNFSDTVQIIGIIVQTIGVIVALATSIVSIKISEKAIKRTEIAEKAKARAYIGIFVDIFDFGSANCYLKVKNFGNSPAKILNIIYPQEIKSPHVFDMCSGLDHLKEITILPGQTIDFPFFAEGLPATPINITVTYNTLEENYTECFSIDMDTADRFVSLRSVSKINNKPDYLKNISYSLQEIAERISKL